MPNLTKSYVGLPLEPYLSPRIHRLLAQWQLLHDLVAGLGSPLNIVLPEEIVEAQNAFAEVRSRHGLRGRVLFARKANRSQALLRALVDSDAGIDVASLGELRDALAAGFTGPRIVAGGPKENAYLWLAVQSGATVFADSISELEALLALTRGAADRGDPVSVGVRLSGFSSIGVRVLSRPSRFGVNIRDLEAALDRITGSEGRLVLTLLGFHLDTTGTAERRTAIMALLGALEVAQQRGLDVRRLDIGGGWGTRYLKHEHQWHDYTAALHDAVLGYRSQITWGDAAFGLRREGQRVGGALRTYPWGTQVSGPEALDVLLNEPVSPGGQRLGSAILDTLCELDIEPGRALAAQAGITLSRVAEVRHSPSGHPLIRVAMNRHDLSIEDTEIFIDPIILPAPGRNDDDALGGPVSGFILGNLCLESDLVSRHLVEFARLPREGDLLAWVSTGGYMMDFSARNALQQPVASKVAMTESIEGAWKWALDEEWWPPPHQATYEG